MKAAFSVWALFTTIFPLVKAYTDLSTQALKSIPSPGDDFDIKSGKLLAPILQPRVPNTAGSEAVRNHFRSFFHDNLPEWNVTFHNFSMSTPLTGNVEVPFTNVIATRDPPGSVSGEVGYLTLVAHYDSKLEPKGFIGATDSAAPCAMLLHIARSLEPVLQKKWAMMADERQKSEHYDDFGGTAKGVKILFLDGEEAFVSWTEQDSVYGARALAADMESTTFPALSTYHNEISAISLFVLLDLLGVSQPFVPSYYKVTDWAYKKLRAVAVRLEEVSAHVKSPLSSWFRGEEETSWLGGFIEDDHLPFMARGVDVLHLIPNPFPEVWHKLEDDGEHLDIAVCKDWAILLTAFAAEWMDLNDAMDAPPDNVKGARESYISKTEL